MSFHVLLNLLNEPKKKDKMRGLIGHLIVFPQCSLTIPIIISEHEMEDSFHHMTLNWHFI